MISVICILVAASCEINGERRNAIIWALAAIVWSGA